MPRKALHLALGLCMTGLFACNGGGNKGEQTSTGIDSNTKAQSIAVKSGGADSTIKLPAGFTATTIAEDLGKARHIAVAPNGVIFIKLGGKKDGKGIIRLQDTNGDGNPDQAIAFGDYGGTGIAIKNGYLYASSNEEVFRYKLDDSFNVTNPDSPEKIITGLLDRHEHESKSIALDNEGNIYVNIGAYSNSCQLEDRKKGSPAQNPCPVLDSAGGIWQFKADKAGQTYGTGVHYATGLRNVVGLDWNTTTNSLFVMQHGRDQLHDLFPDMFDTKKSAELPAECMYELHKGSNCGWPYIYFDPMQHKKIQAPEYGGDGKKEGGKDAQDPVMAFPAHLAPNGLLFYTGDQFPAKYKNGAFIAFHGSWNRAPEPQKGFFVVFVPFSNGKPSGDWEIFADNFSGSPENTAAAKAEHRPCGLAQGPDGSLYVTDDAKGYVWKISYKK
ncbi:MAG TPA: PQQ-dependent sugar dehydrogenase [Puia sp.]|nr:PQQ-dependent sugar dehydrogenase [Puia sp.]